MLNHFFKELILKALKYEPTPGQADLIELLSQFLVDSSEDNIFVLRGYAGTGKTTIISTLVNVLDDCEMNSVLLAPTGRAAKVISQYSGRQANTIHKVIYRQGAVNDGEGIFSIDYNKSKDCIFIVDEASMIANDSYDTSSFGSGYLLNDLIEYVYNRKNCKLILVGDTAQLPPVGLNLSPALDKRELEINFSKEVYDFNLRDVVRQSADSGILYNATLLRLMMAQGDISYPKLHLDTYTDIVSISGVDLIEEIESSYSNYGMDETIIVCRSNKRANAFNMGVRASILYREEELSVGDMLMIVKNNYHWAEDSKRMDFIANGDTARIRRIKGIDECYGFRFAHLSLEFLDYDEEIDVTVLIDTLTSESPSLSKEENKRLYKEIEQDYIDIPNKKKRFEKIRENEYYNALQVKFAYAVTCHKAQGGQWSSVFVDQGWIPTETPDLEYMRWLYTAFTRAREKLYLVNFNKEFFDDNIE
jgi:exodeoxyribonuclease-5